MSTKNVKEFLELIKTDERLARGVTELMSRVKIDGKPCNEKEVIAKNVLPLAKEYGLDFTIDDFAAVADSEIEKLSKDKLLSVSGGKFLRTSALGLLFAAELGVVPSATSSVFNTALCEHVAEAAGLPKEVENSIIAKIKELLENAEINISKEGDTKTLASFTRKIVCCTLEINAIKFTEDEDIHNLFHCTDEDGESFDVSVANLIEIALETPDDIKADIVERIKQRAMGKRLAQPLTFDRFVEDSRAEAYLALFHSENLTVVPDQNNKFMFHCNRNGTKFNVDAAKLIEEALKK